MPTGPATCRDGSWSPQKHEADAQRVNTAEPVVVKSYFPPGHYYSPVPDLSKLAREPTLSRVWPRKAHPTPGVDWRGQAQIQLCRDAFAQQTPMHFPPEATDDPLQYFGANGMFSPVDGWILQALLRHLRPKRMIEIGSGYSSLLAAQVNREFLDEQMRFTCIEPHPRPFLLEGVPGITDLRVEEAQDVPLDFFDELGEGDVLFVDTSHAVKTGGELPLDLRPDSATPWGRRRSAHPRHLSARGIPEAVGARGGKELERELSRSDLPSIQLALRGVVQHAVDDPARPRRAAGDVPRSDRRPHAPAGGAPEIWLLVRTREIQRFLALASDAERTLRTERPVSARAPR